jgi:hypothetical protein
MWWAGCYYLIFRVENLQQLPFGRERLNLGLGFNGPEALEERYQRLGLAFRLLGSRERFEELQQSHITTPLKSLSYQPAYH